MKPLLVGRDAELLELEQALTSTLSDDRGALFLLSGEPGIGKTRLADEITSIAKKKGFVIAWGRCSEVGGAPAFWPWIQIFRKLGREKGQADVVRAYEGALSRLLPELRGPTKEEASFDDARARFRLLDELGALLRALAENAPLALVFDDLHAADPSSIALLQLVARDLRQTRILIVATCRDRDAKPEPAVSEGIRAIAREGTTLTLRRFDIDEVAQFLAAHMPESGVAVSHALAQRVQLSTDGNPLFVEQVSRLLAVRKPDKPSSAAAEIPIPSAMRDAIRGRLAALDPKARSFLEHAAVLGRDFTVAMLAAVTKADEGEASACIAQGVGAGLLHEVLTGQFEICHALFRDALYRDLPTSRRQEIHARAAEALEQTRVPERALGEVARHLLLALPIVGPERALAGSMQSARRALDALAFEDAASILRGALSEVTAGDPRQRAEALILHCEALARASLFEEAQRAGEEATQIGRDLSDPTIVARAGIALGAEIMPGFVSAPLVAILEEARAKLPEESSPLRARVLARLAGALQPAPDPRVPATIAREAVAMARRLGDPSVLRPVLRDAGSALFAVGDPEELAGWDMELLLLSEQIGDLEGAIHARGRLFFEMLDRGYVAEADVELEAFAELADRSGVPEHQWRTLTMRTLRAIWDGRFEDAETFKNQARRIAARAGARILEEAARIAAFQAMGTSLARGEPVGAACLEEIAVRMASFPMANAATIEMRALSAAQNGDVEGVRSLVKQLEGHPILKQAHQCNRLLLDAITLVGDRELAKTLYPIFKADGVTRLFSWGRVGMFVEGPVTWILGTLATAMDDYALAEEHFKSALERAHQVGMKTYEAITCLEYARLLQKKGDLRVSEIRARGRSIAESLGLEHLARRFAETTEEPAATPIVPERKEPAATHVTMTKEGDVWRVTNGASVVIRVKDTRGLQLLAELVSRPGRELHVLSLIGSSSPDAGVVDVGDGGELVDAKAEASYRARIEDLKEMLREAQSFGDSTRAERARGELERLEEELASAFGLGGRKRRASGAAERARVNVQKRLRDAIKRIAEHDASLGRLLERSIRTGTFCAYEP